MPPLPQQGQDKESGLSLSDLITGGKPAQAPKQPVPPQQAPSPVLQQATATPAAAQPSPQQPVPQQQGPPPWEAAIPAIAEKHGLDPELLHRVLKQEHGWENGRPLTSPKGAIGPMQLMPDTAKRYGVDPNDPYQNLGAGAAELSRLLKKYNGHYARALAAYNAGEGAVDKVPNGIPSYPETQNYVMKILQGYQVPQQKTQGSALTPELGGPELTHGQWLMGQLGSMLPEPVQNAMGWMQRNVNIPLEKGSQWTAQQFGDVGRSMFSEEYRPPILPLGQKPGVGVPSAVAGGAMEALGGMVGDPRNWMLMPAGAARPVLQRLMSGGFGIQMSAAALEGAQDLYQNWEKYTPEQRADIVTRSGIDLLFAGQSFHHMGGPVTDPRTGQVSPGLWGGTRPGPRDVSAQPGVTPGPQPSGPVQTGPAQVPSVAQEGGPRPVTSPGISGGRELGGQHPAAAVSAPIEGAGGTTGTVTPKPPGRELVPVGTSGVPPSRTVEEAIGRARGEGLMPDLRQGPGVPRPEGERRQFLKSPEQVQREVQAAMAAEDTAQEAKRQAWNKTEAERQAQLGAQPAGPRPEVSNIDDAVQNAQALLQRAQAAGDPNAVKQVQGLVDSLQKKKAEVQSAQRTTGPAQAPTTTPTAAPSQPVQRGAAEAPAGAAGEPVRPREEPVREPLRPAEPVTPKQPWKPLPPEQRPRVRAEDVGRPPAAPEPAAERKPVEIPKPTPAPKEASAEQRAAWEQKRREEGAQRAAAMAANAPPPAPDRAEKAAGLERTFDRKLKQSEADEARVPGGRKRELDAAIQRERAKGPEAAEKAARQMLNRAGRAQSYIESLQRLAKAAAEGPADEEGKPTPSWDETLREALHESSVRTMEDLNTGRQIPVYKWVTEKGVQGGTRGLARSRAIDAVTAEIYNNIRGNKLKEVGKRVELDEEGQRKLADIQQKYDAVLQEVRKAGGRPTDEQLEDLKKYMNYIHANRGTRMLAEKGPGSEVGEYGERKPLGTGTPKDFLNEVMGWSQKGHLSKPSPEQITARIGQLQQEMSEARSVAERLRAPRAEAEVATPEGAAPSTSPRAYYEDIAKAAGLEYVGESSPGVHRFNYATQAGKTLDISEKRIPETGAVKYLREQAAKFSGAAKTETPAEKPGYGEKNTVFTKDRAEAARARLRDKLGRTSYAGLDPELLKDVSEIMGYHFEAGVREFAELSKRVLNEFGEKVQPYLKDAYEAMLKRGGEYVSKQAPTEKAAPETPKAPEAAKPSAHVPISQLIPGREGYSEEIIQKYEKAYRAGEAVAPLEVLPLKGKNAFQVVEGHHRLEAAKRAGLEKLPIVPSKAAGKAEEAPKTPATGPEKPVEPSKPTPKPVNLPPVEKPGKMAPKAEELVAGLPKPETAPGKGKKEPLPIRTWDEIRGGLEKQGYKYEGRDAADTHTFSKAGAVPIKFKLSDTDIEHLARTAELERMVGVAPKEGKPAPGKVATTAKPGPSGTELADLRKQVAGQLKNLTEGTPEHNEAKRLLKAVDDKIVNHLATRIRQEFPNITEEKFDALVNEASKRLFLEEKPIKGAGVPSPRMQEAIRRELGKGPVERPKPADTLQRAGVSGKPVGRGYRTGEQAPAPEVRPEPEAPKGPSPQRRITDAFNADGQKGLEQFSGDDLRKAREFVGAQTQAGIDAELKAREAQKGEISKLAPKLEPAKQAPAKQEHVRVQVEHPDASEIPVFGKQAIDREDIFKLGERIDKLPRGEDRNDLATSLNATSKQFENLNKRISYISKALRQMEDDGVTTRTRVDKNPASPTYGQKITENYDQLYTRRMLLGKERTEVIEKNVPRLKDTLSALEAKPVAPAPKPVPTKAEPMIIKTYGQEDVYDEQGKLVGRVAPQTGEKAVMPSAAPVEQGEQQRIESLHQHEADLAKLVRKYGGNPPRKAAIVMQQLRKGIKAIRATLPGGGPPSKPYVAPILEGGKLLEKAAREEGRPVPEGEIVEARAKGYVTGAPIIGSVDEAADNLHAWLQGKQEAVPSKVMQFIDNTLFKVGPAGQHIAHQILGDLAKGEFGDLKGDEAPQKAALRLQKALDVLSAGRVKSLSAPKELSEGIGPQDLQSSIRAKAFSDAMHVAKTGVVPAPKPPKSEQAGFLSFGRRGRAAVPPARAAQVSRNAIGQLAKTVEALPASRAMDQRIQNAMRAGQQAVPTTPGSFAQAYQRTVTLGKAIGQAFTKLPRWQDFEKALGDFRVIRTRQAYESRNFVKTLQDKLGVPSLLRQTIHPRTASKEIKAANLRLEAITNYLEADGNEAELARRAGLSGPKVRAGYELASQLNPEEKAIAQAIKEHFESRARDGLALGILHGYVENYAPHIWRDKGHLANIAAELNAGLLNKNFRFAMQRIYGSYFEGEQRGLSPKVKRIDALVAVHDNAFNTAMNTRLLARQLIDGTAADGRPILAFNTSGAVQLTGGQRLDPVKLRMIKRNPALLLKPNSRPFDPNLDMSGYKQINASAFQKWIWKGQSGGKNILMQGDAWVHPDYYNKLDNLTGTSLLRRSLGTVGGLDIKPGDWLLKGTAALKQVQLGAIGSFHYIQEGLHDVWHFRNPLHPDNWSGKRLNDAMTDATVLDGIRHGLNLYEGGADFGEGGAVLDRIPGLGKYIRASTDHLFKTFIPSLKADLYKHVIEKNTKYYADAIRQGKIDVDQLKTISARTVNNAFGELDTLTRNKTFQDVLRLGLLAPDFLEARARFVGQSLRPYGHVPFMAMMRNIGLLYAGARVMNQVINGDPLWDAKYWDGVKIGNKVYRVRSIVGDLFHAASNFNSFAYWRLSPLARPIVASMAQVRKGVPYRLKDAIADTVPIALQGEAKKIIFENIKDPDVARSVWETIGVREEKYYSPEQRRMLEKRSEQRERALRGERSHGLGPLLPSLPRR